MKPIKAITNFWKSIVAGYSSLCYAASTLTLFPRIHHRTEQHKRLPTNPDEIMNKAWEGVGRAFEQVGECMREAIDKTVPKEMQEQVMKEMKKVKEGMEKE